MSFGPAELLIILFILGSLVLPIWGIIDAAIRPDAVWAAAGQNKIVWVLVQIFLWTLGAVIYFIAIRPKLVAALPPGGPEPYRPPGGPG